MHANADKLSFCVLFILVVLHMQLCCNVISSFLVSLARVNGFYSYSISLCDTVLVWLIDVEALNEVLLFFFILQLHLNPIDKVVQLRPSLEHLKSGSSRRKNSVTGDAEVKVKIEESRQETSSGPSKKQVLSLCNLIFCTKLWHYSEEFSRIWTHFVHIGTY